MHACRRWEEDGGCATAADTLDTHHKLLKFRSHTQHKTCRNFRLVGTRAGLTGSKLCYLPDLMASVSLLTYTPSNLHNPVLQNSPLGVLRDVALALQGQQQKRMMACKNNMVPAATATHELIWFPKERMGVCLQGKWSYQRSAELQRIGQAQAPSSHQLYIYFALIAKTPQIVESSLLLHFEEVLLQTRCRCDGL